MKAQVTPVSLRDPVAKRDVPALRLQNGAGLEAVVLPGRALDMYSLSYRGVNVAFTDYKAGIDAEGFAEDGEEGFSKRFFGGFYTTCGLIQSGRPCVEAGRDFRLHGFVSNTPCESVDISEGEGYAQITASVRERHAQGEHLLLRRVLRLWDEKAAFTLGDEVVNLSNAATPFMMMYHINFSTPFLSERLKVDADFDYIENRDTGLSVPARRLLEMGAEGSSERESVYYTRPKKPLSVRLYQPDLGFGCELKTEGDDLNWMGVWKNFLKGRYALGIEPCNCPGLGRARARERGLLPTLGPGESRAHGISAAFSFGR